LVWPFGACEQHGPHLPLITDTYFAENILIKTLDGLPREMPIWMMPSQSIGFSPEHQAFPGTLSLSANVLLSLVEDVGQQIASMGFKRLVFFNAHGGQIGLLQAVSRQLRIKCPSLAVLPCFLWSGVPGLDDLLPHKEVEEGLHAALAETSLMLHMSGDLVRNDFYLDEKMSKEEIVTTPKGWSLEGASPCAWLTEDLSSSGIIGDASCSNPELGAALENALIDHWKSLFTSLLDSDWPPIMSEKPISSS
jgi:creatinine amidohydrolase